MLLSRWVLFVFLNVLKVFPNARPVRLMGVEFLDGMFALVEDYMNGEMELDALVDRLDSFYDMMLMG